MGKADEARVPSFSPSVPAWSARPSLAQLIHACGNVLVALGVVCAMAAVVRMWRRRSVFWDAMNQKSPKLSGMRRIDSV